MAKYSNARAMRALIKASLQSIFKSPSAIVFSIAFPLIFILVFGFLGENRNYNIKVSDAPGTDTANEMYAMLHHAPMLRWIAQKDSSSLNKMLSEGDIVAAVNVQKQPAGSTPQYAVTLNAAGSLMDKAMQLKEIINGIIQHRDPEIQKRVAMLAKVDLHASAVRDYKTIDFILPGQLGFSLLAAGVFGTAFVFFNLRQTLVLKRFFATPVRREVIVVSEGIARMLFQITGAIVIIGIGHLAFSYTLLHGAVTFLTMLVVCALGMLVFMGFGFIISSLAKSESSIPPLSNLVTLPQFLLAGTFFPIDNFPKWLQPLCRALPLTYLNDALRRIAFDGVGLWAVRIDLLILLVWGIVVYIAAARLFKWE